ncbi:YraN family protein [Romboutsia sp. 1001713B170131_170501_G6]|uniref:YraN family protein n=1 Tax=Romboutsia sp. 1001713B170131_170501_G6 TaxID=2787108 RepID=UPI0018A8EB80|nr:YraN family protein [Romboutsia sp. 1001713B170131_170501_G6]
MNNKEKGNLGEKIAYKYLIQKGFKVLDTNYRIRSGEVDIIAKFEDELVFVEVKSRMDLRFGHGRDAINNKKIKKITNTAKHYIFAKKFYDSKIRFDVIEVYFMDKKINHIENAF